MKRVFALFGKIYSKVDIGYFPMLTMNGTVPDYEMGQRTGPHSAEGTDSLTLNKSTPSTFAQAERRFRTALPSLLEDRDKFGKWVLFSPLGFIEEADSEDSLYEKHGKRIGSDYFLGRVQPDPPEAEITSNWFATVEVVKPGKSPGRTR